MIFWSVTLLSWLVVLASPTISIEGDLEEITYLSLPLFFILSPKMGDEAFALYSPERNFLRKWAISSWKKGALYSKKLEQSKNGNSHSTPLVKTKREICSQPSGCS